MFVINEDQSIYCTRGDAVSFSVSAAVGESSYTFREGDVVRFKVFAKKDCESVVLQKDITVEALSASVTVSLDGSDTKIGGIISKPTDYWYEVELNPDTYPQTIIGYDGDGARIFRLFPEGGAINEQL